MVADIHKAFKDKTMSKSYLCVAVGCPEANPALAGRRFTVDAPIEQSPDEKVARMVGPGWCCSVRILSDVSPWLHAQPVIHPG